jgi:hypothetical protein
MLESDQTGLFVATSAGVSHVLISLAESGTFSWRQSCVSLAESGTFNWRQSCVSLVQSRASSLTTLILSKYYLAPPARLTTNINTTTRYHHHHHHHHLPTTTTTTHHHHHHHYLHHHHLETLSRRRSRARCSQPFTTLWYRPSSATSTRSQQTARKEVRDGRDQFHCKT